MTESLNRTVHVDMDDPQNKNAVAGPDIPAEGAPPADPAPSDDNALPPQEQRTEAEPEREPEPEKPKTKRQSAMESIALNRRRVLNDQGMNIDVAPDPDAEPDEDEDQEPPPEGDEQAPKKKPAQQQPPAQGDPPETTHRIVVEGRAFDVKQSDLVKMAQLGLTAETRFQQAAALRQQAEQIRGNTQASAGAPQTGATTVPSGTPTANPPATPQVDDIDPAAIAQALQFGTAEEGQAAIAKLSSALARQAVTISPDEIAAQVAGQVQQRIAVDADLQQFGRDNPDLIADAGLVHIGSQFVHAIRRRDEQMGIQRPDRERWYEAADLTRGWAEKTFGVKLQRTGPTAANPQPSAPPANGTIQRRMEAKRQLPTQPTAASTRAITPQEPRPKTRSEAVADMRRARGQAA